MQNFSELKVFWNANVYFSGCVIVKWMLRCLLLRLDSVWRLLNFAQFRDFRLSRIKDAKRGKSEVVSSENQIRKWEKIDDKWKNRSKVEFERETNQGRTEFIILCKRFSMKTRNLPTKKDFCQVLVKFTHCRICHFQVNFVNYTSIFRRIFFQFKVNKNRGILKIGKKYRKVLNQFLNNSFEF